MRRTKFLQELTDFLVFGTGFFGVICLLSLLLPVANAVTGIVPLPQEGASLATSLAILAGFFAFAYSFTEKAHIVEFEMRRPFFRGEIVNPRRDMLHNAAARFAWGLISLVAYFVLVAGKVALQANNAEAAQWLIPVIQPLSVVFYALAFGLATGAFGSLAVMQHARQRQAEAEPRRISLGARDQRHVAQEGRILSSSPDGVDESQYEA